MAEYKVINLESTNEIPNNTVFKHTFQKISTANGNIYAWNSSMDVGKDWTSISLCDKAIQNQPDSPNSPYNIQIIHNYKHKPMININKGNKTVLRQEINRWEFRNLNGWYKDETINLIQ